MHRRQVMTITRTSFLRPVSRPQSSLSTNTSGGISAGIGGGGQRNTLPMPWENGTNFSEISDDMIDVIPPDLVDVGDSVLEAGRGSIESMLRGEIPEDVQAALEQISAERGIQSGLGLGEASRNLTARDLGRTSLDLISEGARLGGQLSADEMARAQYENSFNQWRSTFELNQEQWQKQFEFGLAQADEASRRWESEFSRTGEMDAERLALAGQQMIMQNEQFAQSLASNLIQANSHNRISGLQQILDSILGQGGIDGFGFDLNEAIRDIIES